MKRREFITLLGGAAAAWPLVAGTQTRDKFARIGFLTLNSGPNANIEGFEHGLRQLGYVEGESGPDISMGRGTKGSVG
jgi:hypothetical protein